MTRRLYGLVLPYKRTVALGMLCLVLAVAAELSPPLIWKNVVDVGIANRDVRYIAVQLLLLLGVIALGQVLSAWRGVLLERAGQDLVYQLRLRLYRRLAAQSASFYGRNQTGDLLARLTGDVESVQDVLVRGTDAVIANALRILGVAAIFIALQPWLGVATILPMIAVAFLLTRYNKNVRPTYQRARNRLGQIGALFADQLGGMRVIQAFARERQSESKVEVLARDLYDQQIEAVRLRNKTFPVIRFVANLGNVIMIGGGALLVLAGQFTLGGLVAYRGYGRYFLGPIDDLVGISDLVQRAEAAGRRVFEVLDAPLDVVDAEDAVNLAALDGDVRFERVSFAYDGERPVLHDLDLHVRPGERVAILGLSGAGKSTLLGLLTRAFDATGGRVLIDGHDVRSVTLHSLRSNIGVVQQEPYLFYASVLENVRFACPNAPLRDVEDALRSAHALNFVRELPEGLETIVGERGVKLSGGQRQRVAIARTLLAKPKVLLLDEPTSSVDPESEEIIVAALTALMRGRTSLVVTHRLSLARAADRVVVLEGGRIAEQGTPAELRRLGGRYASFECAGSIPIEV
ncbi:ATP-binding cassette subfamily B protein [Deinococcus yavapaiensis KR-236]|uniref:ATP-binding cassette subfamily B protein n=1 Tax=Deinococcus yavapaiensis KR-236 TaxID=694435 RepID=A0A318S237_9DEIO|nr:ATP-binding cassette subfamily B protein [Deinococcus yavapaiensis KR-236]